MTRFQPYRRHRSFGAAAPPATNQWDAIAGISDAIGGITTSVITTVGAGKQAKRDREAAAKAAKNAPAYSPPPSSAYQSSSRGGGGGVSPWLIGLGIGVLVLGAGGVFWYTRKPAKPVVAVVT